MVTPGKGFHPNEAGLGAMLHSGRFQELVHQVAERGAETARRLASEHQDTGAYADSFEVKDGPSLKGDRVASFIVSDDPGAVFIEFGNASREGLHVLGRTASEITDPRGRDDVG